MESEKTQKMGGFEVIRHTDQEQFSMGVEEMLEEGKVVLASGLVATSYGMEWWATLAVVE